MHCQLGNLINQLLVFDLQSTDIGEEFKMKKYLLLFSDEESEPS